MSPAGGFDFSDQVVLITGGGAGIGQGIARAFFDAGARVALGDIRADSAHRAAGGLGDGTRVFAQAMDVCDPRSVAGFVEATEKALGPVSVAVANAGIYPNTPVLDMDVDEWDQVMATNARGVFLTCQAAARRMVARVAPGKIVTISSGAYSSGRPGAAHYCASKAAVVMFTRVLALELARYRINVNCVAPGFVRVDSEVSPLAEEYVSTLLKSVPWGRAGTPADVAQAVLFLASPYSEYMTGEVLAVNGGTSAGRMHLPLSTPRRR
ncbi:MAG TPA: SDR family NAD(P)-dependent oxidoreductase [Methylomirabilota bacterium]|nr:SDR family NAD(P)-dependent oxidoreductase [Methylomirabilota bacterium]